MAKLFIFVRLSKNAIATIPAIAHIIKNHYLWGIVLMKAHMDFSKSLTLSAVFIALAAFPAKGQDVLAESFSLFDGGYEKTNWEIVLGYVNKSWVCTYDSGTQREDFFGDPEDKFLHGMQIGALYTPSFDWGLGLRTGLFFEAYTSRSKWIKYWCHHFTEADLYIPLQASYRIPFTEDIALNLFGGIGFQWAMDGRYFKQVGTVWSWWRRPIPILTDAKHQYGNGWPEKVNWQAECGLNFRFQMLALSFTYSFGLVDHGIQNTFDEGKTYVTASRSRQDKIQASLSIIF